MKRILRSLPIIGILLIFTSCQSSREHGSEISIPSDTQSPLSLKQWKQLFRLRTQILQQPDNPELISQFLKHAVDSSRGYIFSVGYGIVQPSNLTSGIQLQFGEQAALMDAERWAAYIQYWERLPSNQRRLDSIAAHQKLPLFSKEVVIHKDTLYVFATFRMVRANYSRK